MLALYQTKTPTFPLLLESMRALNISDNPMIRWSVHGVAASPLPNLESLRTDSNPDITNAHVLAILAPSLKKNSLRSLSVDTCPDMDFSSLAWLIKRSENLENLAIGGNGTVTDEVLKEVAGFKKLECLDLTFSGISSTGLMNVVNGSGTSTGGCRSVYH